MDLIETQVNPHEHEAMPEQTEKQVKARRRLKITRKDLRLHGYTATRPRCSLLAFACHIYGSSRFAGCPLEAVLWRARVSDRRTLAGPAGVRRRLGDGASVGGAAGIAGRGA